MANEIVTTLVGNLTGDPELRFLPQGVAVCTFTVAHTERKWDAEAGKMQDGDTTFIRCTAWRNEAEHIAESLVKGSRVVAQVQLKQRSFEVEGQKRSTIEGTVLEVGVSLKFNTAKPERPNSSPPPAQQQTAAQPAGQDPWASAPPPEEPPF